MRPVRTLASCGIALSLFVHLTALANDVAATGPTSERFRVTGELRPAAASTCGRFELSGEARPFSESVSSDGRIDVSVEENVVEG